MSVNDILYRVYLNKKYWGNFYGPDAYDVLQQVNAKLGAKAAITLVEVKEQKV